MRMMTRLTRLARRWGALLAAVSLVGALGAVGFVTPPAHADGPVFTRTDGKADLEKGDVVTFRGVDLTPGDDIWVFQCVGGVDYTTDILIGTVDVQGHPVFGIEAMCPSLWEAKLGKQATSRVDAAGTIDARMFVFAGHNSGTVGDANTSERVPITRDCGPDHACTLLFFDITAFQVVGSLPLTFAPPIGGQCGAPSDGSATFAGPFSMTPVYRRWAVGSCAKDSATPLLADYTESGEQPALQNFQLGNNDAAFAAVGFDPPGGTKVTGTRAALFVPVALQAAVIGFDANFQSNEADAIVRSTSINQLDATLPELAAVFSDSGADDSPIVARSPGLQQARAFRSGIVVRGSGALAIPDAVSLTATTAFTQTASGVWTLGVTDRFPATQLSGQLKLASNYVSLLSMVSDNFYDNFDAPANGARLYVTDSVTADRLGLTPVRLRNASGDFVGPTTESMQTAVKGMARNPDGTLFADPRGSTANAYPLPMVIYAVVPKDPFPHRETLAAFLDHALNAGQNELPRGMYPLPADLLAQAKAMLPQVGVAPKPGTTPGEHGDAPSASTGPGATDGSGGTDPGGSLSGLPGGPFDGATGSLPSGLDDGTSAGLGTSAGPGGTAGTIGGTGTRAVRRETPQAARQVADTLDVPLFPGLAGVSRIASLLGLAGLVALVSAAGYTASGRPLPEPLRRLAGQAGRRVRAVRWPRLPTPLRRRG